MSGFVVSVQGNRRNPSSIVISRQQAHNNDNQLWCDDPATGTVRSKFNEMCLDVEGLFMRILFLTWNIVSVIFLVFVIQRF